MMTLTKTIASFLFCLFLTSSFARAVGPRANDPIIYTYEMPKQTKFPTIQYGFTEKKNVYVKIGDQDWEKFGTGATLAPASEGSVNSNKFSGVKRPPQQVDDTTFAAIETKEGMQIVDNRGNSFRFPRHRNEIFAGFFNVNNIRNQNSGRTLDVYVPSSFQSTPQSFVEGKESLAIPLLERKSNAKRPPVVTSKYRAPKIDSKMNEKLQAFLSWETQSNPAGQRSNKAVTIENYEIPLDALTSDIADRTSKDLLSSLVFTKNGKKYVRWIINPEDSTHYQAVESFLKKKGLSTERHQYFNAYETASRSYVLVTDPGTKKEFAFSAKVSTDSTGGKWRAKKLTVDQSVDTRTASDYVQDTIRKKDFNHIVVLDEPMMFGIKGIDQALLVRDLSPLTQGENFYLPGFSVFDEDVGAKIAALNGSLNPSEYWNENANKPLGRALGEFFGRTGLIHNAPHNQNWLVELDKNLKPTGRIVLRDFGDEVWTYKPYFKMTGQTLPGQRGFYEDYFRISFGEFNGTNIPNWLEKGFTDIGKSIYYENAPLLSKRDDSLNLSEGRQKWVQDYYDAFSNEFKKVSTISGMNFKSGIHEDVLSHAFSATYTEPDEKAFQEWAKAIQKINSSKPITGNRCGIKMGSTLKKTF